MTREEAKRRAELYSAVANGKTIQIQCTNGEWSDVKNSTLLCIDDDRFIYRVKPEPKYRPFETKEECWQEMMKHQPFGWVIDKLENFQHLAIVYSCDSNSCDSDNGDRVGLSTAAVSIDFENMFKDFKFADGAPFGIKE